MTESDRRSLSFRQAEGLDPIPGPLAIGEISQEARALIWTVLYVDLVQTKEESERSHWQNWVGGHWIDILIDWHVRNQHLPVDEFNPALGEWAANIKTKVLRNHLTYLFDFLTFVMRHKKRPQKLVDGLSEAFEEGRLAYSISENTIYPIPSAAEATAIRGAFADLAASEFNGARSHLAEAGRLLTGGDWAGSVRESIHSVESIARSIEPNASTLSDALKKIANGGRINPNLKRGFEALYNYTSDEQGVRHARVFESSSSVTQADAAYMFGSCASFVSFLIAQKLSAAS